MDPATLNILITVGISVFTAMTGAYFTYRKMNSDDDKVRGAERRELKDDLYKEIDRLNLSNESLRTENIKAQSKILELSKVILELQTKINLLEIRLGQLGHESPLGVSGAKLP